MYGGGLMMADEKEGEWHVGWVDDRCMCEWMA